jgi:hypothetical protein
MLEERENERCVELLKLQVGWRGAKLAAGELEE